MKRAWLGVSTLVALLAISPLAEAQGPPGGGGRGGRGGFGGGPGMGGGISMLVGVEQVQKEIGLEGDSLTAVKEAVNGFREDMRGAFGGLGDFRSMSEEERNAARQKMQEKMQAMSKEHETILKELLSDSQMARLQEISLQQRGNRALTDADVAAKLGLTEEQKNKITETLNDADVAQRELFGRGREGGGQPNFAEIREKMDAHRKETDTKVLAVLTDEQKEKLTAMKGKPFELDRGAFGGFGGGRPRGEGDAGGDSNRTRRPPTE